MSLVHFKSNHNKLFSRKTEVVNKYMHLRKYFFQYCYGIVLKQHIVS